MAGWDFDRGDGTPSVNATLKMSYSTIEWNGCNQEYPAVDANPAISCYSQSTGGYGDGIGTPSNDGMDAYIDHSIFRYNTQDGEDFGHIDTGSHTLSITNSVSYGNNGGQFKWGPGFANVTFNNNLAVTNCLRLSQPISGTPSTFNAHLGDFCRAFDGISFTLHNNATVLMANNTFVGYAPTSFDIQCYDGANSCANTSVTFRNNIVRGYDNATTYNMGGQGGGPGGFYFAGAAIGTFTRDHNLFYGLRNNCIANVAFGGTVASATAESCADADFTHEPATFASEATLDNFNFAILAGGPADSSGVASASVTTDFTGAARSNPPSRGALEVGSQATLNTVDTWPSRNLLASAPAGPVATSTKLSVLPVTSYLLNTTFTTKVMPASGPGIPQGTVTLYYLNYVIGTANLDSTGIGQLGLSSVHLEAWSSFGVQRIGSIPWVELTAAQRQQQQPLSSASRKSPGKSKDLPGLCFAWLFVFLTAAPSHPRRSSQWLAAACPRSRCADPEDAFRLAEPGSKARGAG